MSPAVIVLLEAVVLVGACWTITKLVDVFTPMWDSLYDQRSPWQKYVDARRDR